jgi:dsDNA-specific endonuclease/ATPase MutS2
MSKHIKSQKEMCFYDFTLDLHGYTLENAIYELEKVLYSGKYRTVLVVHGLGHGILLNGIREYLKTNTFIKNYYLGEELNIQGRAGVTLIEL